MVADLGYTIRKKEDEQKFVASLPQAAHGYDNQEKAMHAFFLVRGPAFKEGAWVKSFQNIHVYELISYLMGTEPAPNDGSLDSVKILLQ